MKKIISLGLIMLLVITGSMTGCAKKEDSAKNTALDNTGVLYEGEQGRTGSTGETSNQEAATDRGEAGSQGHTESLGDADTQYSMEKDSVSVEFDAEIAGKTSDELKAGSTFRYDYGYPGISGTEEYTEFDEIGFKDTSVSPLSTFSIDVDTASYTNLRKNLNYGILPDPESVRIEEMLNYFTYDYEEPTGDETFTVNTEIGRCPWNEENYLLTVGILGKSVEVDNLPKSNLVFLIDVSGSMDEPDKLPLLKNAFSQLVKVLGEKDRVSMVVYAGESGVVLDSVPGSEKDILLNAIESLQAGGSTGGAGGINLAYQLAEENFIKGGNNRIILATDGDFNVGPSTPAELEEIIEEKRESGIFLSVMGFGTGNLKDNRMEVLADKGNGNYSYIDSTREAKKVLVDEMAGTLLTIAKDVKIQLEFNPYSVASYRLIGYENRALADEDFKDDTVDAGELGSGHRVTAIYEIVPKGAAARDDLKYQEPESDGSEKYKDEITEIRLRFKEPGGKESKEIRQVVSFFNTPVNKAKQTEDFYFAAAVAQFGMILRDSIYKGDASLSSVLELAEKGLGEDADGYRLEFMNLVDRYKELRDYQW